MTRFEAAFEHAEWLWDNDLTDDERDEIVADDADLADDEQPTDKQYDHAKLEWLYATANVMIDSGDF